MITVSIAKKPIVTRTRFDSRRASPTFRSLLKTVRDEAGIALIVALVIMVSLSALGLALVILTENQIRLGKVVETQTQAYYAALAGLEEVRGRLEPTAPDAISSSLLPQRVNDVLYLVNSSTGDPVNPTSTLSRYFDSEYATEFSGGLGSARVLGTLPSDQPGAGTAFTIPYKWVRVTLKTEYSSRQDVDQDGVLDRTTPVYWDGSHQDLAPRLPGGSPIYKVTALAVEPSGIRKLAQAEVAGSGGSLASMPSASLSTEGNGTIAGYGRYRRGFRFRGRRFRRFTNLTVSGLDACGAQNVIGVSAGGTVNTSGWVALDGSPTPTSQRVSPISPTASAVMQSQQASAIPILTADLNHVALSSGGTSYVGTDVVLGQQASSSRSAQPVVAYSDKPLTISGPNSTGSGVLLVNGDLSIRGGFSYNGLVVATGRVTLASDGSGSVSLRGAVISAGDLSVDSTASRFTSVTIDYDSCAVSASFKNSPQGVKLLASRELSY